MTATADATIATTVSGTGTIASSGGNVRIGSYHNYDRTQPPADRFLDAQRGRRQPLAPSASVCCSRPTAPASTPRAKSGVSTTTGAGTNLEARLGTVTVEARSGNFALATAKTNGGGLISVTGDIDPHAIASGRTSADLLGSVRHVDDGVTSAGANALEVTAEGVDLATAVLDTSSGGAINVDTASDSLALVGRRDGNPTDPLHDVSAQLGASTSVIMVTTTAVVHGGQHDRCRRQHACRLRRRHQRRRSSTPPSTPTR